MIYGSYHWGKICGKNKPERSDFDSESEKPTIPPLIPMWVKGPASLAIGTYLFYGLTIEDQWSLAIVFSEEWRSTFFGILVVLLGAYFGGYYAARDNRSNKK